MLQGLDQMIHIKFCLSLWEWGLHAFIALAEFLFLYNVTGTVICVAPDNAHRSIKMFFDFHSECGEQLSRDCDDFQIAEVEDYGAKCDVDTARCNLSL